MRFLPPKGSFGRCRLYLLLAWAFVIFFWAASMDLDDKFNKTFNNSLPLLNHRSFAILFFAISLLPSLSQCLQEAWHKMSASEKRIRELEEKIEKLLSEKSERENALAQVSSAPDERYFSPR